MNREIKKLLVFIILLAPFCLLSQSEYRFVYDLKLNSQESSYALTEEKQDLSDVSMIHFSVTDVNENPLPLVRIELRKDTLTYGSITSVNGNASFELSTGIYSLLVNQLGFVKLNVDSFLLRPNTRITFHLRLGMDNSLKHGKVYSVRELSLQELNQIQTDWELNHENKLVKNKTCYIILEI